jgi:hypothetical protein
MKRLNDIFVTSVSKTGNRLLKESGENYFKMWMELGSLGRVINQLTQSGVVNPASGKPIHQNTVWRMIFKWIIENPTTPGVKEAFEKSNGRLIGQDEWELFLCKEAIHVCGSTSRARLRGWIRRHKMEKYKDLFDQRFPGLIE